MQRALLIALAGAIGTTFRYGINLWITKQWAPTFPFATLIVNVLGCFLIAVIAQYAVLSSMNDTLRLSLTTGFMGGLTTYSSFNYETTKLLQTQPKLAVINVFVTMVLCFIAGLFGLWLGRKLA